MVLFLLATMFCTMVSPLYVEAQTVDVEQTTQQYYKLSTNESGELYFERVGVDEFEMAMMQRTSPWYVEGWNVVTISGYTAAHISLYYQTTVSAGKKVFDLSTAYFEVNRQNGYAGELYYESSSVHSLNMRYEYLNLFKESGYRKHTFYPEQRS